MSMLSLKKGFTLVELLVVMAIISLLVGAIVFVIRPADYIKRSRDTRRVSDLKVIQTALEQSYGYENAYAAAIPYNGGAFKSGDGLVTYLNTTPKDPDSSKQYCYLKDKTCGGTASPGAYVLCAQLEASTGTPDCQLPAGSCAFGSAVYNHCVTNPF